MYIKFAIIFILIFTSFTQTTGQDCTELSCIATGALKQQYTTRVPQKCMEGYFWGGQSCQPCKPIQGGHYACTSYWGTGTLYCLSGWTILNGVCVNLPNGCLTYQLNQDQNAYVCGSCDTGFTLIAGVCVQNQECVTYSSTRYVCTQCQQGYYLNWDYIPDVSSASDNYYNYFGSFCNPCSIPSCANCPSANTCTQCKPGFFWSFSGLTSTSVTSGSGTCEKCLDNCINCTNNSNCTQCSDGYYANTVNGITTCSSCQPSTTCVKCSNSTTCTQCLSGYQLLNPTSCEKLYDGCTQMDTNKNCTSCQSNYILNAQSPKTCTPCGTGCATCQLNNNIATCTACQEFYYATKDSNGIVTCAECKSYPQSTGWLRCGGPNDNPSYTTVQATQCIDGYFLVNITTNNITTPTCIAAIPSSACLTLTTTSTNTNNVCATCVPNYSPYIDGTCLSCPPQQGAKTQLSSQCNKCSGSSTTNISCAGCSQRYFLQSANSAVSATCATCSASGGCLECQSNLNCTKCDVGYYKTGDSNNSVCQPCLKNCAVCTDSIKCTTCMDGYFAYTGSQTAQSACVACQFGCATCNNPGNSCQSCIDGYVLQSGGCVPLNQANCAVKLNSTTTTTIQTYNSNGCSICKYGFHMISNRCFQSVQPYAGFAYKQLSEQTVINDTPQFGFILTSIFIMLQFII
ncbi:unnamed protein product [Paramecium octaurelia]|uniref:EGF-like domain-containing protein n=1 Tax=Paramecium octaurelia TaxID=43137 RepID=A0A8S1VWT8_PAROT|nr:unnamed protein product [Paramecium octaurelia]